MERVCTTDVFFYHICFEQNSDVDFSNYPHSKQDPRPLCHRSTEFLNEGIRSKLVYKVFLLFDNVKEIRSPNNAWKGYLKT